MGPKKKGKKSKKQKEEKEKPRRTLKSEYIAKIAERNGVLAGARKRFQGVEDAYFEAERRYEQTQQDMADIMKYLQNEIEENELEIASYDEKIASYKMEIDKNDKYYQAIITKLETEYEEKEKELQYQIQKNTAKLSAFEEVKQQREEYLRKKEELYRKMREMETRHRQEIYEAEKAAIIKQDTMQKEMEANLQKLAIDFRQASDIAIGETTNELIRDNITLGNMLTCTQELFDRARESYNKVHELEKQYKYNAELLDVEHVLILEKYSKQVNRIETLIKFHEEIHKKIKMSEKLIRENRRLQRQIAENECIIKEKVIELGDLKKVLKNNTDIFNSIKNNLNTLRRNVVHLEMSLYEAAKRVKHAVDIEYITRLPDEPTEEGLLEGGKDEKEQEENLKEFKYKTREAAIEEIIEKLGRTILSEMEIPSMGPSSEFHLENKQESGINDLEIKKSNNDSLITNPPLAATD